MMKRMDDRIAPDPAAMLARQVKGFERHSFWVGIFVGVSLLFDGIALIAIGWSLRKG